MTNFNINTPEVEEVNGLTYISTIVTIEGHKAPISIFTRYNGTELQVVNIRVNNASQRAYGSLGKEFYSIEEAANNYKGKKGEAIKAALEVMVAAYTVEEEVTISSVEVTRAEGKEGELEGTYNTIEDFNQAVKNTSIWKGNNGAKIWVTLHLSNEDTHDLRYDVSNYNDAEGRALSNNGTVDLRARLLNWAKYIGTDRWLQFQNTFKVSEEDRAKELAYAARFTQWVHNTPVKAIVKPVEVQTNKVTTNDAAQLYTLWTGGTTTFQA